MSGNTESGSERSVYLAGPIEADDSPRSWRDELRARYPEVDWIDPMDWQDEWEDDPSAIWERELETVRTTAVLACNIGTDAPRTTGTHHEIREALNHGQDVAIVPEGDVSQIYREIENARIFENSGEAVRWLARSEKAVVPDGGTVESGKERSEAAFEVAYECENCGAEWEDTYPSRTLIHEGTQTETHNKDCDSLGTVGCDCCSVISCPVCELVENVTVDDQSPIQGDRDD